MNHGHAPTFLGTTGAACVLLLSACAPASEVVYPKPRSSVPSSSPANAAVNRVNLGGVVLHFPEGFEAIGKENEYAQVGRMPNGGGGMNMFVVHTVVDSRGRFVRGPADALAWYQGQDNFEVEDLGTLHVSGQDVPLARVTSKNGAPLACGPGATSTDNSCFMTGSPGPVYGFFRVGDRTVVVERGSLAEMHEWGALLSIEQS